MGKQKFSLTRELSELNLDPTLANVLEESRPLGAATLKRAERKLDELIGLNEVLGLVGHTNALSIAAGSFAEMTDAWTGAVLNGVVSFVASGDWTAQDAYRVLCLGAGSCLRREASEPFRLVLSVLTRAGVRPEEMDRAPTHPLPNATAPTAEWAAKAAIFGAMHEVKGAQLVACLARGLGVSRAQGLIDEAGARAIFRNRAMYRASSPIGALVRVS
jgi:hypothetical protein